MKLTSIYLLFFIGLFALNSCDRAHHNTSKITLTMPAENQNMLSTNVTSLNAVTALNDWAPLIPTGLSGDQPVNCYFVAVTGPDPIMRTRSCYKTLSSSTSVIQQPIFSYGLITGPIPAGQTIELDVPSGPDRVFKILAAHATSANECKMDFSKENLSKPYILGELGQVNLQPNVESTLTIPVSFDSNQYVDGCDLVAPPPTPAAPPSHISLQMENPLFGEHIYDDQCVPVNVSITDASGIITFMNSADITLGFESNTATPYASFSDFNKCSVGVSLDSTFIFPKNVFKTKRWLRVVSSWASADSMGFSPMPPTLNLRPMPVKYHVNSFDGTFFANTPDFIKNDICYPIYISRRQLGNDSNPLLSGENISLDAIESTVGTVSFHASSDCSGAGTPQYNPSSYGAITIDKVFFKTSAIPLGETISFRIQNDGISTDNTRFVARLKGGLSVSNRFKVKGPIHLERLASPVCHGPYRLFLTNEVDTETQNNLATNRVFRFVYNDTSVQFYQTQNCSTGIISSDTTQGTAHLIIPPNETSRDFYLKVPAAAVSGDRTISIFDDERGLNYLFKIFINVP